MSGTFPTAICPKDAELISLQPSLVSISDSGKRQARYAGGHLWEAIFNYPMLTREQFEPINAFVMFQHGGVGEFQVVMPQKKIPLGIATGTPLVSGIHAVDDTTILIIGFTPNITGILKAGDILKFDGHSKVYMCVVDADSDVTGSATITIEPPIISALANVESVIVSGVEFTMFITDVNKYKTTSPMIMTYKVRMKESL